MHHNKLKNNAHYNTHTEMPFTVCFEFHMENRSEENVCFRQLFWDGRKHRKTNENAIENKLFVNFKFLDNWYKATRIV